VGKGKREEGGGTEEGSGLAGSHLDPDERRNLRAESRSSSRSRLESRSETLDIGALVRAIGDAHNNGGVSARSTIDSTTRALEDAHKIIAKKDESIAARDVTIATLNAQITQASEHAVMIRMLESREKAGEVEAKEKWSAVKHAFTVLGPAAQPIASYLGKFLAGAPTAPAAGDRSPRAHALRFLLRLRDGSDASNTVVEMMASLAAEDGEDAWPGVLAFLSELAAQIGAEQAAQQAGAQGVPSGHA